MHCVQLHEATFGLYWLHFTPTKFLLFFFFNMLLALLTRLTEIQKNFLSKS